MLSENCDFYKVLTSVEAIRRLDLNVFWSALSINCSRLASGKMTSCTKFDLPNMNMQYVGHSGAIVKS